MAAKIRVQITMDEDLLEQVDNYCEKNYMNRSWLISQSLLQILNQQKLIDAISDVSIALQEVSKTGVIDDATKRDMEKFEMLCKMFVGK